jgi:hypothetical protein
MFCNKKSLVIAVNTMDGCNIGIVNSRKKPRVFKMLKL